MTAPHTRPSALAATGAVLAAAATIGLWGPAGTGVEPVIAVAWSALAVVAALAELWLSRGHAARTAVAVPVLGLASAILVASTFAHLATRAADSAAPLAVRR